MNKGKQINYLSKNVNLSFVARPRAKSKPRIANLFAILLSILLLGFGAPRAQAQNLTVTITKTDNTSTTVTGAASLEGAVGATPLGEVAKLEISAGDFTADDWRWLRLKNLSLNALTHLTVTDDVSSVADIPGTSAIYSYFSKQIKEVSVAKITSIGDNVFHGRPALSIVSAPQVDSIGSGTFYGCTALSAASFPLATSIGQEAFHGCTALTNLMLGATPPPNIGTDAFKDCPDTRFLIPVDADGVPLTGSDLTNALALYNNVDDGGIGDDLWYGWKLGEVLYPIVTSITGNGTVSTPRYAPANAMVRPIFTPDVYHMLQGLSCAKQGGGGVDIDMSNYTFTMPADGVTLDVTFVPNVLQVFVNNESTARTGTSLENALVGVTLGDIASLTITGGSFLATDWGWLWANRDALSALTCFTITDGANTVSDIYNTNYFNPYFGGQIRELNVARVTSIGEAAFIHCASLTTVNFPQATSIGGQAFYGCIALSSASFPQATSIGGQAFYGCGVLTNLMLGATPPSVGTNAFDCPENRFLVPVNADGVPLAEQDLANALGLYKAVNDGNTGDNLWYGWKLEETLHPIIINTSSNGTVSSTYKYVPANTMVRVIVTPDVGYMLQDLSCAKQGEGEVAIDMNSHIFIMPADGVSVSATFVPNVLQVTVNDLTAKTGTSLANALDGVALGNITSLEIIGGSFLAADWLWLKANRGAFGALTHFTITDGARSVADIPNAGFGEPYFGEQIKELNVAKVAKIGACAIQYCPALTTVSFPHVFDIGRVAFFYSAALNTGNFPLATSIGNGAFSGCAALSNLMLGETPPSVGSNIFDGCSANRFLILVDANGTPLVDANLNNALTSYKNIDDGNPNDSLWYGWKLGETLYPIEINVTGNGTVISSYSYAPADNTVTLTITIDAGYIIQSLTCAKLGGGEVAIDTTSYTFTMPAEGVAVNAAFVPNLLVTVNGSTAKSGTSLENALSGVTLGDITSLTITGGPFLASDWNWLKDNRDILTALTHFTITDGANSVADIPDTYSDSPYFGEQIMELNMARVASIGASAFSGCTALTTASFPLVTSISDSAFVNCIALGNLMLGATPPNVADANAFGNCPDTRFLIPVNASGVPLTDANLTTALAAYDASEGPINDKLWYGWRLEETLYPIAIDPADNGTVSAPQYASADATVTLVVIPDAGYIHQSLSYTKQSGGGAIAIDTSSCAFTMPNEGVTINATFVPNLLVTVNGSIAKSGTSLENALDGVALEQIFSLTITGGPFFEADWNWIRNKRTDLGALTHFTITDGVSSVADMPDVEWGGDPYFGEQIVEVSVVKIAKIGNFAFLDRTALTTAIFPQATNIGASAFAGCALTTASFPQLISIGWNAFSRCTALITATFPRVTGIGNGAFSECTSLSTANFPLVTSISSHAFFGCTSLSTANFPLATGIEWNAFFGCTALSTASFPLVTSIGGSAFSGCTFLTTASFPQTTDIDLGAFSGCTALSNLMLGATPPNVADANAFENCPNTRFLIPVNADGMPLIDANLTASLTAYDTSEGPTDDNLWYGWSLEETLYPIAINPADNGKVGAPQYAPADATVTLLVAPNAGYIPQNLSYTKQSGGGAIAIDVSRRTFIMPDDGVAVNAAFVPNLLVTVNGSIAKSGTSLENALSGVTLGDITSLTITGGPFLASDWNWLKDNRTDLSALTHFTVTDGANSVADIPDTYSDSPYFGDQIIKLSVARVASIGGFAFSGRTALATASFPQATDIGSQAFHGCAVLSTASFPKVTAIGSQAFHGCVLLNTASFPKVTAIGSQAFHGCTVLSNLMLGAIPPNVADANAFENCPDTRFLIPVNANGVPLTGQSLTNALTLYNNVDDGGIGDNLWYGWKLEEKTLYPIRISTISNGTVSSGYPYAPVDATVALIITPDAGYILQNLSCARQGGGEVTIDMNSHTFTMPNDSVTVNATFVPSLLVTVNGSSDKTGTSLENALSGVALEQITSLTITGGPFLTSDWYWLRDNRDILTALTRFTITDGASSVADLPGLGDYRPYFGGQIIEVSVAKAARIGHRAFIECTALSTVSFPQATNIGGEAFWGCAALSTTSFPQVTNIDGFAFSSCTALSTASFPLVTAIGRSAFSGCTALVTASFPLATAIDRSAFSGCTALVTASFPLATGIGQEAFSNCAALNNLMLGSTPPSVGTDAFSNCHSPRFLVPVNANGVPLVDAKLINVSEMYKNIDDGDTSDSFWYGWIVEPTYPITINPVSNGTVSSDYRYAPANKTVRLIVTPEVGYMLRGLSCAKQGGGEVVIDMNSHTFTMPAEGVIVNATFEPNMLRLTVNGSADKTGTSLENALSGVTLGEITSLTITGGAFFETDWIWLRTKRTDLNALTHFTITGGVGSVADIPNTEGGNSYFGEQIKSLGVAKIAGIGEYAFHGCTALTSVNFPQATNIGAHAFHGCTALTSVNFPQATNIGAHAFNGCTALTSVNFPQATNIGAHAFNGCTSLSTASFPLVTGIGSQAFKDCTALTAVSFPLITSIGNGAFYGCSALTAASFPLATSIGRSAFHGCTSLSTASFPLVTGISDNAFYGCTALSTVSFPLLTSIGFSAFAGCTALNTASFPLVTGIGYGAFYGCTALGTANFPQVTIIGERVFYGCIVLANLMLGATPPTNVGTDAFMYCPETRFLIPVNADGTPLTDQELTTALEAYDANEGQVDDKLWYGWKLEEALYPITINLVGNGTVSVPQYAPVDATVTITVSPNIGYRLKEGSLRAYKTGEEGTTVTITGDKFTMPAYGVTVECEFEGIPYTVTVAAGIANGTLAADPNEDITMGTEVTLTAAPATGYRLKEGSLRAYKTGEEGTTVTITGDKFTMPAHDVTVTCEFEPIQHTVSFDTPENGTLSVIAHGIPVFSGDNVNVGTVLTITATPETGYMINSLTVNGTAFESGGTHEVVANVEIAVVFTEVTSINNVVAPTYILYPNPTNGKVTIEGSQQPMDITVYNSLGVAVHIQQLNPEETLDLGHLPDGVYIIRVNNTTTLRVVKR